MTYEPTNSDEYFARPQTFWDSMSRLFKFLAPGDDLHGQAKGAADPWATAQTSGDQDRQREKTFQLFDAASLVGADLVIVGESALGHISPYEPQFEKCRNVVSAHQPKAAERYLKASDAALRVMIVNVEDTDTCVDWLLRFREQEPEVVIVLTSADFARNELTSERSAICDASLRQPVSPVSLSLGLTAALNNRRTYLMDRDRHAVV